MLQRASEGREQTALRHVYGCGAHTSSGGDISRDNFGGVVGWEPYCSGLEKEPGGRTETKNGLSSPGAQPWGQENVGARLGQRKGFYLRGEMLGLFVC